MHDRKAAGYEGWEDVIFDLSKEGLGVERSCISCYP